MEKVTYDQLPEIARDIIYSRIIAPWMLQEERTNANNYEDNKICGGTGPLDENTFLDWSKVKHDYLGWIGIAKIFGDRLLSGGLTTGEPLSCDELKKVIHSLAPFILG